MTTRGKKLLQLSLKSLEKTKQATSQETEKTETVSEAGMLLKDYLFIFLKDP